MRKQFVNTTEKIIDNNKDTVLLLGDIGVFGFRNLFKKYPARVFNIGILEQSTIGIAAGLSLTDFIPIVHTITPFLVERCLEQLKIDFGYQKLRGNFVSVGASYDYAALGPTHHCPADVQLLKTIPGMQIVIPGTSNEFNTLFNEGYDNDSPTYYRLSEEENSLELDVKFGYGNLIKKGKDATIVVVGPLLDDVLEATKNMDVTILYYTTVTPFDSNLLIDNTKSEKVILIEPYYEGALNYEISKCLQNKPISFLNIGVPHMFMTNYGQKTEHDRVNGLTPDLMVKKICDFIYG